jgi:LPXTG-motif cell wall-anchored protein
MGSLADVVGFPPVLVGFSLMAIIGIAMLLRKRKNLIVSE